MKHELQLALEVSQAERASDPALRAAADERAAAIAAGKFVLIMVSPAYCPRTDALMGTSRETLSIHDTRAEADAELGRVFESWGEPCGDGPDLLVLPLPAYVHADAFVDNGEDDIAF